LTEVSSPSKDLAAYCRDVALRAKEASRAVATIGGGAKSEWLRRSAARLRASRKELADANEEDIAAAPEFGLSDAEVDRLRLTGDRIEAIARGLEDVAALPEPIGQVIDSSVRPNGLEIRKIRVPLGVVFFIYESRPNVTADAAAICVKAGNAVILRGGKEARHSSRAIVDVLHAAADETGLPKDAVQLVETTDRAAIGHFLGMSDLIDLAIPRGGEGLIRRVAADAKMPVIKHFTGNCHVYVDRTADLDMATRIVVNAKCQRMGVCNACESLLVHSGIAHDFLKRAVPALEKHGIEIRGCERTRQLAPSAKPATEEDFAAEYLGPLLSVRIVESVDWAIDHINQYGSGHTDAIVTRDLNAARQFASRVDSSAVMINASTRFNDGGEFGLGAEIGISTDKFHARGPCGVTELTSYKYVVEGTGQIRE
jgi:glutamate-5-semialdehyde dehydrogenase